MDTDHINWLASTYRNSPSLMECLESPNFHPETKKRIVQAENANQVHQIICSTKYLKHHLRHTFLPNAKYEKGLSYYELHRDVLYFTQQGKDHYYDEDGWFVKLRTSTNPSQTYEDMINDFDFMQDFCSALQVVVRKMK